MQGHIFGQGHRQVKAQSQVRVALLEAVNLLFRLAAALGQEHLRGLNHRGVQRGEAIQGVSAPQNFHHPFHLLLGFWQQLHKAGQSPGGHRSHGGCSFYLV